MSSSLTQKHEIFDETANLRLNEPNRTADADNLLQEIKKLREEMERLRSENIQDEEENQRLSKSINDVESRIKFARFRSRFVEEFTVTGVLGIGGCGCVFEGKKKLDDFSYAVKRIAVEPKNIDKALEEVRAMARLDHHAIVKYNCTWIENPPEEWQILADDKMFKDIELKNRQLADVKEWNTKKNDIRNQIQKCKSNPAFIYIQMQV
ncbi:hypothetical protein PENTCL1PPCAC_21709, partial [Pristionchus entomophagus]